MIHTSGMSAQRMVRDAWQADCGAIRWRLCTARISKRGGDRRRTRKKIEFDWGRRRARYEIFLRRGHIVRHFTVWPWAFRRPILDAVMAAAGAGTGCDPSAIFNPQLGYLVDRTFAGMPVVERQLIAITPQGHSHSKADKRKGKCGEESRPAQARHSLPAVFTGMW